LAGKEGLARENWGLWREGFITMGVGWEVYGMFGGLPEGI